MINVTKTFLPPQEEYNAILKSAWDNGWITNRGVLVQELENKLKDYLQVPNIINTTNGTLPLQIAIKALDLTGEIITTPFSYVASTSSIVWEGCTPIFVDIHPEYLTIDEAKIERAITPKTTAILATHIFGNPCAVKEIEVIAKKYNLKVVYDAAHCFGVTYKGQSVFNYGDVSTCSFHATKLFHTGEGGCLVSGNRNIHDKMFKMHNFGHDGPGKFSDVGINGKMSELQAALGLTVLPYVDKLIKERELIVKTYNTEFKDLNINTFRLREYTIWNSSYYPIIVENQDIVLKLIDLLCKNKIGARRYFYPSLNTLSYIQKTSMPISEDIAKRILCIPIYNGLTQKEVKHISNLIKSVII